MKNFPKLLAVTLIGMSLQASAQEIVGESANQRSANAYIEKHLDTTKADQEKLRNEMRKFVDLDPGRYSADKAGVDRALGMFRQLDPLDAKKLLGANLYVEVQKKLQAIAPGPYAEYVKCFSALQPPFSKVGPDGDGKNVVGKQKDIVIFGSEIPNEYFAMTPKGISHFTVPVLAPDTHEGGGQIIALSVPGKDPVTMILKRGTPPSVQEFDQKALSKDAVFEPVSVSASKLGELPAKIASDIMKDDLKRQIRSIPKAFRKAALPQDLQSNLMELMNSPQRADAPESRLLFAHDTEQYLDHLNACKGLENKALDVYKEVVTAKSDVRDIDRRLVDAEINKLHMDDNEAPLKVVPPAQSGVVPVPVPQKGGVVGSKSE